MREPQLVPHAALEGVIIAVSVSESADLERLGLTSSHCEQAAAELSRAVLLAGGALMYGGRLDPPGFTDVIANEAATYGRKSALILAVPYPEHDRLTTQELDRAQRRFSLRVKIVLLDPWGRPLLDEATSSVLDHDARAYTAMRRYVAGQCKARVLVGGKLQGSRSRIPGVIEEAVESLRAKQPLYVAGGFGGAAATVAKRLGYDDFGWAPPGYPEGGEVEHVQKALDELEEVYDDTVDDGLTPEERAQLAITHRPGDIASLVVLGLSRAHTRSSPIKTIKPGGDQ